MLHSELTSFVLVCSPRRDTVDEALYLVTQMAASGAEATTVVVNRCYPSYAALPSATADALAGTPLSSLVVNLDQLSAVASTQDSQLARVASALPKATVLRVPVPVARRCGPRVTGRGGRLPGLGRTTPGPLPAWAA